MALSKIGSDGIVNDAVGPTQLDETANYSFSGTVTGAGVTNKPAFHTYFNSSLSISTNTSTKITPLNEVFDTDSAFATDKFTVPTGEGGKYFIYGCVMYSSDVTYPHAEFYVNGSGSLNSESLTGNLGGTGNRSCFTSRTLTLSAGDYVELYTFQGSSATSIQNSGRTFFGGYKLF